MGTTLYLTIFIVTSIASALSVSCVGSTCAPSLSSSTTGTDSVMVLSTLLRSMVIWTWSTVLTTDSGPSMVMESKSKLVLSSI